MQFMMSCIDHYEVFINMSTVSLLMASKVKHVQLYMNMFNFICG